jgi:glycosyltransferase involved in cell wall biosynthesis
MTHLAQTAAPPRETPLAATLVVPCYDEAARLPVATFEAFAQKNPELSFLFVDDGSTDGTHALLTEMSQRRPAAFSVLRLPRNCGKAEAVRQGMLEATRGEAAFAGYWDADLATPLEAALEFAALLRARPDLQLVMGARVQLLGREIVRNAARHYVGRVFATLASQTLRLPVYDTQCGAKLFRVSDLSRRVFETPFVTRWIFDVELLARLLRDAPGAGYADASALIVEFPLQRWVDVQGSKIGVGGYVRSVADLVRLWWHYGRGPGAPRPPAQRL